MHREGFNLFAMTVPAPRVSQVCSVAFQQQSHAREQCRVASLLHGIERRAFRLEPPELAFRLGRIRSVLPPCPLTAREPFSRPRSCALAAMHPTAPFPADRWRSTGPAVLRARAGPAPTGPQEIAGRIAVLKPTAFHRLHLLAEITLAEPTRTTVNPHAR